MTSSINTQITLDTPIAMLTPRQLFEMQEQWFQDYLKNHQQHDEDETKLGITGSFEVLANALHISKPTVMRWRKDGRFGDAIKQIGPRSFRIDLDAALQMVQVKTKRNYSLR
jgi:hypothetical protein